LRADVGRGSLRFTYRNSSDKTAALGLKPSYLLRAFTAPFDFAQDRLEIVPFHDPSSRAHYARICQRLRLDW
jgi:hypothetical protein